MAIQLNTQTAQQQKAPFSAFDTTSSYRSGLSGVAEGISKVGQAAFNIQRFKANQKTQAQKLLASEAATNYEVQLDEVSKNLDAAYESGDVSEINRVKQQFNALGKPDFNKFLPDTAGGVIEDMDVLAPYQQRASETWGKLNNTYELKANAYKISNNSKDFLSATRSNVVKAITQNPTGLSPENFNTLLSGLDPTTNVYQILVDGQPNDQTREAFKADAGSSVLAAIKHQLKTASSPEELLSRKEQSDAFLETHAESYGFTPDQALDFETVYASRLKTVSDTTYLKDEAEKEYGSVTSSYDNFFNLTKASDIYKAASDLETRIIRAKDNPYILEKHADKIAEMEEVLSMFIPEVDSEGNPTTDSSIVDRLARRLILNTPDKRPSFADFRQIVDENQSLSDSAVTAIQSYINNRIGIAERGIADGDLTSLGALYPELQKHISSGDTNSARLYYQEEVLPELTAKGLDAGLYGEAGGNIKLPPMFWFGAENPAFPVNEVAASTSVVLDLLTKNAGYEGALTDGAMAVIGNSKTSSDMRQTYQLASAAAYAVKLGDDPQAVIETSLNFAKLAHDNKDNSEVNDIYDSLMLEEDTGDTTGVDILDTVQKIKQLMGSNRAGEAAYFESQLKGQIADGLFKRKTPEDIKEDIQAHEDQYVRPYMGSLRETREGQPTFIHPDVYRENVDPSYERAGFFGRLLNPFSKLPRFGGKTGAKRVAEYNLAAVTAYAAKNFDLSNLKGFLEDTSYGISEFPTAPTSPYGGVGGSMYIPEKTELLKKQKAFGPEEQKAFDLKNQEATYAGLLNNDYHSKGMGIFGAKGVGVPIMQLRGTTFRTAKDQYGNPVEKEFYVLEVMNPRTQQYEPFADNNGEEVIVPVDAVNPKIRSAILEDVNLSPFDMATGDVFGSKTGPQNRMWRLFNQ